MGSRLPDKRNSSGGKHKLKFLIANACKIRSKVIIFGANENGGYTVVPVKFKVVNLFNSFHWHWHLYPEIKCFVHTFVHSWIPLSFPAEGPSVGRSVGGSVGWWGWRSTTQFHRRQPTCVSVDTSVLYFWKEKLFRLGCRGVPCAIECWIESSRVYRVHVCIQCTNTKERDTVVEVHRKLHEARLTLVTKNSSTFSAFLCSVSRCRRNRYHHCSVFHARRYSSGSSSSIAFVRRRAYNTHSVYMLVNLHESRC